MYQLSRLEDFPLDAQSREDGGTLRPHYSRVSRVTNNRGRSEPKGLFKDAQTSGEVQDLPDLALIGEDVPDGAVVEVDRPGVHLGEESDSVFVGVADLQNLVLVAADLEHLTS